MKLSRPTSCDLCDKGSQICTFNQMERSSQRTSTRAVVGEDELVGQPESLSP